MLVTSLLGPGDFSGGYDKLQVGIPSQLAPSWQFLDDFIDVSKDGMIC